MDLIDRKQALKEISDRHKEAVEWFLGTTNNDFIKAKAESALASYTECYITILKLPSAEPKTEKWEDEGWYADGHDHHVYSCPACAKCFIKRQDEIEEFKYCPNCGADMRGDEKRDIFPKPYEEVTPDGR